MTVWNALRVRFAHIQRKNDFNFAILENLRIFQNCLFTGGVWRRTLSVTPDGVPAPPRGRLWALPETLPPPPKAVPLGKVASPQAMTEGVALRESVLALSGANAPALPKGELLAKLYTLQFNRKLCRHAKASPFGRGGTAYAVTERARMLTVFLCFAQTAHSLHVKSAKNLCQSKV